MSQLNEKGSDCITTGTEPCFGGASRLTYMVDQLRQDKENVFMFDILQVLQRICYSRVHGRGGNSKSRGAPFLLERPTFFV
jgi:hypothetical protein